MPTVFGGRLEDAIKRVAKIEAEIRRVEYQAARDKKKLSRLRDILKEARSYYSSLVKEYRSKQ
jgi:hypothetical protein